MPFGMGSAGWFMPPYFYPYWYGGNYPYYGAGYYPTPYAPMPKEDEIRMLEEESKALEQELSEIRKRIEELKKK